MHQIHNLTLFYNIYYFSINIHARVRKKKDRTIDNYIEFFITLKFIYLETASFSLFSKQQ